MEKIIKRRGLKRPAAASVWYMASASLTKAVGVLVTPIFTRLLTENEYGSFSLYMSWLGLASVICSAVSSGSVIYKGLEKFRDERDRFISSAMGVLLAFCAVICLLLFAFSQVIGLSYGLVALMSVQLFCDTAVGVSMSEKRYSYDYIKVAALTLMQAVVSPVIGFILISGAGLGYFGRIYGLLFASVIVAAPALITAFERGGIPYEKRTWSYIARRSAPLLPHSVSAAVSAQADKLIITALMGTAALAKYSVAHSLGAGLIMTVTALSSALNPWILRKLSSGKREVISEVLGSGVLMLASAVLFLIGGAPEAMRILAPAEYSDALGAVAPIALSTIPAFVGSVAAVGMISAERSGGVSVSAALSSVISAAANLLLIPALGYLGAGLALFIGQSAGAVISVYFLVRSGIGDMLPGRRLAEALLFAVLWAPALSAAAGRPLLRLAMLIPPVIVLIQSGLRIKDFILEGY